LSGSGVSRETLARVTAPYRLPSVAVDQLAVLLEALAAEPDPHTTFSDPDTALQAHIADSLSALELQALQHARRVADLGAGPGFPGLVLAIALPSASFDLIESAGRKGAVISRLAQAARVGNARPVVARAEEWAATPASLGGGGEAYGAVTARAVGELALIAEYAAPLLELDGALVAWKGARHPQEESRGTTAAERLGLRAEEVRRVVPFEGARNRHLHVFRKVAPTPAGFPRRPGMARKRPLA
jgi:16S rRNA (guanine527-N7)-methyltransferase